MGCTRTIADFIAQSHIDGFSQDVIDMSERCLLDWLGVTLGGAEDAVSLPIIGFVNETGGRRRGCNRQCRAGKRP